MPTFTRTHLKARINSRIKGKIGVLANEDQTCDDAARAVFSDIDLRSARRKTPLSPPLFNRQGEYTCPTDLKDYKIIDIDPQTDRKQTEYDLVPFEEFGRKQKTNTIAISDNDFVRKILVNASIQDTSVVVSSLDSLTAGGGTWVAFGGVTNVAADADNYVRGSGSVSFDISAVSNTFAGIQNQSINSFNLAPYLGGNGSAFVWAYITSTTNISSFRIQLGSTVNDYYQQTITTQADGTAFVNGWNLLRFDLASMTVSSGSPNSAAITYAAMFMVKSTAKINETDYRFDELVFKKGEIHNVVYYTKYPWQSSSGTYKETSTADSDLLNVDTTEFDLVLEKAVEIAGEEVDELDASNRAAKKYAEKKKAYMMANPSEAKFMISTYAEFIEM